MFRPIAQAPQSLAGNYSVTDTEVERVSGGVSDLGKYITKAVDDALSAAIGGNSGIVHPGMPGHIQPYQIDPGMTPQQL
jgi:hypothetical protein